MRAMTVRLFVNNFMSILSFQASWSQLASVVEVMMMIVWYLGTSNNETVTVILNIDTKQ